MEGDFDVLRVSAEFSAALTVGRVIRWVGTGDPVPTRHAHEPNVLTTFPDDQGFRDFVVEGLPFRIEQGPQITDKKDPAT